MKPDTGSEAATNIVKCIVSVIYRLTVSLVVEFIKIGALLAITVGSCLVLGVAYLGLVVWAYTSYDGSFLAAAGAGIIGALLLAGVGKLLEFVVRDLLQLTDLSLTELFALISKVVVGRKKAGCQGDHSVTDQSIQVSYLHFTGSLMYYQYLSFENVFWSLLLTSYKFNIFNGIGSVRHASLLSSSNPT